MNIANLSIKRPILISSIVVLMVIMGIIGFNRLGVDLYPPMDFPVFTVLTVYPGATPEEIEKLISKPLEEQISTISGLKHLSSRNMESVSLIIMEFTFETDIGSAEQKVREKVALARNQLPEDLMDEPTVKLFDFNNMPVITLAVMGDLPPTELYDLTKEKIKPILEQVNGVGEVRLSGGTRREIQVELDRKKLNDYQIPALLVANQLKNSGANIPIGKFDEGKNSMLYRAIGEYKNVDQIKKTVIQFVGDVSNSITLEKLATVKDSTEEPKTYAYLYYPVNEEKSKGIIDNIFNKEKEQPIKKEMKPCIVLDIMKQSGTNTVEIADKVNKRIPKINDILKEYNNKAKLVFVNDTAKFIRKNIDDVKETMFLGIILAVFVVYLFLGNVRSTLITGIAIPNSILGAFVLMYFMGFTINLLTLMGLSLTVGLLVDDAIVVRENIFRKLEKGMDSFEAAEKGTKEVMLAVIATTLTILAVFFPIAFLEGVVGRIFKQFGLCVVFAMSISLFDALTVAPFLSAYFAGSGEKSNNYLVRKFDKFQDWLDKVYVTVVSFCINRPLLIIVITIMVFLLSITALGYVKKTFQPSPDEGEFMVTISMPSGTSLDGTRETSMKIADKIIKTFPELHHMNVQVGNEQSEAEKASIGVFMVHKSQRNKNSNELKTALRKMMNEWAYAEPAVDDYQRDSSGLSMKPYILALKGENLDVLFDYSNKVIERLKKIPDLTDVATSVQAGKPEFQIKFDDQKMQMFGVSQKVAGGELRYHIEGHVVGKLHDKGLEYDIRMRLKPEQRDLMSSYKETRVPNMMFKMIPLSALSSVETAKGPANILRTERARIVQITANTSIDGALGSALSATKQIIEKDLPLPEGVTYSIVGQAEAYQELIVNMSIAFFLALVFIYLVLASLYESFITPVTILLAIPPALSGAYLALFFTGQMLDIFGWIGIIVLLGLVTKNSILLVDFALEGVRSGLSRKDAIKEAGLIRLRPILMTTFAMIAGTAPMALGIGEAAKFRQSMGIAIMGGIIVSTLITLLVVPSVFEYIDIFREWIESKFRPKGVEKVHAELSDIQKDIVEACKIDAVLEEKSVKPFKKKKSALKGRKEPA